MLKSIQLNLKLPPRFHVLSELVKFREYKIQNQLLQRYETNKYLNEISSVVSYLCHCLTNSLEVP